MTRLPASSKEFKAGKNAGYAILNVCSNWRSKVISHSGAPDATRARGSQEYRHGDNSLDSLWNMLDLSFSTVR
jgi:hypothetical protein